MVPVRFPPGTLEEVRRLAAADDRSVSSWIRRAVEHLAPALTALGLSGRGATITLGVDGGDGGDGSTLAVTRMIPFNYSLTGEGLCCGFDSETPVSDRYESPYRFSGQLENVVLAVAGTAPEHPEKDAERARLVQ